MASPNRNSEPTIKRSEQYVLNSSFDETYGVLAVNPLGYNGTALQSMPTPLFTKPFDRIVITYTDSTKATIATIVTKLSGVTQETLTNSSTATVDDFVRT